MTRATARRSSKKSSSKATAKKPKDWDPRKVHLELALPFVTYLDRPPGEDQCNWWDIPAVAQEKATADTCAFMHSMLGRRYAQLAVRFMADNAGSGAAEHLLSHIVGSMAEQGCLSRGWSASALAADGFVSQIGAYLQNSARLLVREAPVVIPPFPEVEGREFLVRIPGRDTLVCDPDAPIEHNMPVVIICAGQLLAEGVVETKHPAKAKTLIVRVGNMQLRAPGDIGRADLAPVVATQHRWVGPSRSETEVNGVAGE